jgi:hypothetical protein
LSEAEAPQPTVNVQVRSPSPSGIFLKWSSPAARRDSWGSQTNLRFAIWTQTTRQQHSRPAARYQADLTDAEFGDRATLIDGCTTADQQR